MVFLKATFNAHYNCEPVRHQSSGWLSEQVRRLAVQVVVVVVCSAWSETENLWTVCIHCITATGGSVLADSAESER